MSDQQSKDVNLENFVELAMRTSGTSSEVMTKLVVERFKDPQIKTEFWDLVGVLLASGHRADLLKRAAIYGKMVPAFPRNPVDSSVAPEEFSLDHRNVRLLHGALGLVTESIEVLSAVVDSISGRPLDIVNLVEECGDIAWYQAEIFDAVGADHQSCLQKVIDKLRARYSEKFTSEEALNRNLQRERDVLEGRA